MKLLNDIESAVGLGLLAVVGLVAYKYRDNLFEMAKWLSGTNGDGQDNLGGGGAGTGGPQPGGQHDENDMIPNSGIPFVDWFNEWLFGGVAGSAYDFGTGIREDTAPAVSDQVEQIANQVSDWFENLVGIGGEQPAGYTGPTQTPEQAGLAPFTPPTQEQLTSPDNTWSLTAPITSTLDTIAQVITQAVSWTPGTDPSNDAATLPANGTPVNVGGSAASEAIAWNGGLIDPDTGGYFTGYGPEVAGPQYPGSPGALLAVGTPAAPEPTAPTVYYDPDLTAISSKPLESDWIATPATAPIVQSMVYNTPAPAPVYVPPPAPTYTAPAAAQQTQTYIRMGGAHQVI